MKKPFRISDINFDKILYSEPIEKNNKKSILLKYQNGKKNEQLLIQTPELLCIEKPLLKNSIYEISVALESESSSKVNNLIEFIGKLESKIIDLAEKNTSWFNGKNSNYHKMIREHTNYKNGILKLKVKIDNLDKLLKVTKNNQMSISSLNEIERNNNIKMVLDIYGLWIKPTKNNSYYYGLYVKPVLIDFKENIDEEISFRESESEDFNNDVLDTEIDINIKDNNTETSLFNIDSKAVSDVKTEVDIDFSKFNISSDMNFDTDNKLTDEKSDNELSDENNFYDNESSKEEKVFENSEEKEILENLNDNINLDEETDSSDSENNIIGNYNNDSSSTSLSEKNEDKSLTL